MIDYLLSYTDRVIAIISIVIGIVGLVSSRVYVRDWIRLHKTSSGKLLTDDFGTNVAKGDINKQGYQYYLKVVRKRVDNRFGRKGYDVIATPAEVDYLFAFLLAHITNKRFCSIHTSSEWPSQLTRFRYNSIEKGDRVVLVAVILSSGKFMIPAIDIVLQAGATVSGVVTIIEARPGPDEETSVEELLLSKNVYFDAIHRQFDES